MEFAGLDEAERETLIQLLTKVTASMETIDVDAVVAATKPRRRP